MMVHGQNAIELGRKEAVAIAGTVTRGAGRTAEAAALQGPTQGCAGMTKQKAVHQLAGQDFVDSGTIAPHPGDAGIRDIGLVLAISPGHRHGHRLGGAEGGLEGR